jgi:hypothetical protein
MKAKYLLLVLLLFTSVACNKKNVTNSGGKTDSLTTDNPDTTQQQPPNPNPFIIEEALFTNPLRVATKKSDPVILNRLIKYVNYTPTGATIYINIYRFNYEPLRMALIKAFKRGVVVEIVIDGDRDDRTNKPTIKSLRNILSRPSNVVVVKSDAAPPPHLEAIDHEKYALFSKVYLSQGIARNLVVAASQNFMSVGTKRANNAVVMTSKMLYNIFLDNWKEVEARSNSGMKHFTYSVKSVGDSITCFFFPRKEDGKWDGKNTIIEQLNKLDRSGYTKDSVRVVMAGWGKTHGLVIAKKLTDMEKKGAKVEVITKDGINSSVQRELHKMESQGGYLKIVNSSTEGLHSKTMLIKGILDEKMQRIVLTGSYNYTKHALEFNNEFIIKLKNSVLFKDYWYNFNELKKDYK